MAKILLVDDDPDTVARLDAILREAGHQVSTHHTTDDLARALRDIAPDLIILDNHFPGAPHAGIETARALSADPQLCRVPVLMLTALNRNSGLPLRITEADISEDFLPVDAFLDKPVDAATLRDRVAALLHPAHRPPVRRCPPATP